MELKTTPLIEQHRANGAGLSPFGGWLMPIQYSGIISEHQWTRTAVSIFDICHMGEFFIRGDSFETGLSKIVTVDFGSMPVDTCRYGFILNEEGGFVDDAVVYRLENDAWMVVVNAATTEPDAGHFKKNLAPGTPFEDASERLGKLDLQGPASERILRSLIGEEISGLSYYTFGYFKLWNERILISRTGYTGERGYELYFPVEKIEYAWLRFLDIPEVKPAGLGARDTLRLEMGYALYGQDIDPSHTPLEAGLESFIDFKKEFIGKEALQCSRDRGISRHLVFFMAQTRRAPRHEYRILNLKREEIGSVTSGSFSPSLQRGIGMGYVTAALKPGDRILINDGVRDMEAEIVKKPFYKKGTAR